MRILINAVSAKMGGAATYIRELASHVSARGIAHDFVFLVPPEHVESLQHLAPAARIVPSDCSHASKWKRLWFDQVTLRRLLREEHIDVLFSTANFGLIGGPCPQALLVCNSIYFSRLYRERYLHSFPQRLLHALQRCLIWASVHSSRMLITPSHTMLAELRDWMHLPGSTTVAVLPYGVNPVRPASARPCTGSDPVTLLFTSLYADHKNLGTLLRGLRELVRDRRNVRLLTTADPSWPAAQDTRDHRRDARLAQSPEIASRIELAMKNATVRPDALYSRSDIFVYPSVVESFGHPLIEAMAYGLPVVAADVPINREICGDAALYFSPFDPRDLARAISSLLDDPDLARDLSRRSLTRSAEFDWDQHVSQLLSTLSHGSPSLQTTQLDMPARVHP